MSFFSNAFHIIETALCTQTTVNVRKCVWWVNLCACSVCCCVDVVLAICGLYADIPRHATDDAHCREIMPKSDVKLLVHLSQCVKYSNTALCIWPQYKTMVTEWMLKKQCAVLRFALPKSCFSPIYFYFLSFVLWPFFITENVRCCLFPCSTWEPKCSVLECLVCSFQRPQWPVCSRQKFAA